MENNIQSNAETLRQQRIENILDATNFREPKKVPVGAEIISWPFSYAGVRYEDVMDDPRRAADAYVKFLDDVELDFMEGASITFPVKAFQTLGNNSYQIASDGCTVQHNQVDMEYMAPEEYEDLANDPVGFAAAFRSRRLPVLRLPQKEREERILQALRETRCWMQTNQYIRDYLDHVKGIVTLESCPIDYMSPLSEILDSYRGIRDTLLDLRKRPEQVDRACEALLQLKKEELAHLDPMEYASGFPLAATGYHAEPFLSPKQYDKYYLKGFKEIALPMMEVGMKFFLKGEGSFIRTADWLRQFPKGSMVIMLDEDDPFEMHKVIGDWQTLACGITADLLQTGTKQKCIDYVNRCFDTFAPGGGFIFMQNKPLLCANDAKIENLLAVYETANRRSRGE